ncbi:hypothetical protein F6R98_10555 [Candidatus Methylospira mobilis]|uniref:Uncharacterized protein n=1 Tax=Candidatus Methylospira mobilis TaxID=1808979 RepID=A0A5Q0BLC0_9GAMM|nr:hypothetical protein [Candidatus Methylospira mobilis]QFY43001.1 hypothetical protein F6R98_10555 [Candidatus Methylospira mobilis]
MVLGALSSLWGELSPHLIASFFEVDRSGARMGSGAEVKAPLTDSNLEATLNWQSPFEQAGPESKAPALLAMLQSGALQPIMDVMLGKAANATGIDVSGAQQKSNAFLKQFDGRTGITKLNSTQVFTGMPPVKISVTALFRAWRDAISEVEAPVDQLWDWALPQELSKDGAIVGSLKAASGEQSALDALLPSHAPTMIGVTYKGRTYAPLVIESIGYPISSPISSSGNYVELSVPMTLCTLTAWDRNDRKKTR